MMNSTSTASSLSPEDYEHQNVHTVYEAIAPHFSRTRYKPWPVVDRFLRTRAPGSVGLDVGCGNGKYLGVNPNVVIVGSDRSEALVNIAAQHHHSQPTRTQQAATSHRHSSVETGSRLNVDSEESPQHSGRPRPDQRNRSHQTHASHDQSEKFGRETHAERDSARQQANPRQRGRQSQSHPPPPTHSINQLVPDQHPGPATNNGLSDLRIGDRHNASSTSTSSKASTATVIVADTLALPHPDCTFDFAICIAVIHHLSTRERRVQAISHIVNKLRASTRRSSSGEVRGIRRSKETDLSRDRHRKDAGDSDGRGEKSNSSRDEGGSRENALLEEQMRKEKNESSAGGDLTSSDAQPGQALIFVWALEQKSSRRGFDTGDSQDQLVPWVLKPDLNAVSTKERRPKVSKASASAKKSVSSGGSEAEPRRDDGADRPLTGDAVAGSNGQRIDQEPGVKGSEKRFHRFYHLYQEGEMESECEEAGARVVERGYDRDNWWVAIEPGKGAEGRYEKG